MKTFYLKAIKTAILLAIEARGLAKSPGMEKAIASAPNPPEIAPQSVLHYSSLPTTAETRTELRRRLGKELFRMELDLQGGARIAGKPCDCLGRSKHTLGIEATAEELMSYGYDPVYGQIIDFLKKHQTDFEPEEIGKRDPEYYRSLAPEVRDFRKKVMGTESVGALISTPTLVETNPEAARPVLEVLKDYPEIQKVTEGSNPKKEFPIRYEARLWRKWANMDDVYRSFATEQEAYDYSTHLRYIANAGDKITIRRSQEWDVKVLHRETIDKDGLFWAVRKPFEPIPTEPIGSSPKEPWQTTQAGKSPKAVTPEVASG